jgi:pyruvate ferredoxin oxidoreductase beta subunit
MNTGNQRSGSTPLGADSTTAPVGKAISGKLQLKKSIVDIVAGHEGVYAATAATAEPWDFMRKMQTALEFKGPSFIAMLAPCVRFWRIPDDSGPEVTKLAIETKYWPLWEYNMGVYKVTKKPKTFKPIKDYVTKLGRYSKLMKRPDANEILEELQNYVDAKWDRLLALEEITKDKPLRTKI